MESGTDNNQTPPLIATQGQPVDVSATQLHESVIHTPETVVEPLNGLLPQGNTEKNDSLKDNLEQNEPKPIRKPNGQLLPGAVINPKGMEKGTLHFKTLLIKFMRNMSKINPETGFPETYDEIIARQLLERCTDKLSRDNLKAVAMLLDRVDGKPVQAIDLMSGGQRVGIANIDPERQAMIEKMFGIDAQEISCGIEDPKIKCKIVNCATCRTKTINATDPVPAHNIG